MVAVTGLYLAVDNRRLRSAEANRDDSVATAAITKSALLLVGPLQKKIGELESRASNQDTQLAAQASRITDLEGGIRLRDIEVEGLRAGIIVLTSQLKRLNIVPEYTTPPKIKTGPLGHMKVV